MGTAAAAAPLGSLLGCGSDGGRGHAPDAGHPLDAAADPDAAADAAAGLDAAADAGADAAVGPQWATGGTAAMTGDYPDPFAEGPGETCTLTLESTLGPCYAATLVRRDISEGIDGLPLRLALLVVDETCEPIEGAEVDVWHTSPRGFYSGDDAAQMCTLDDEEALSTRAFRGVQVTDAAGRVDFDTCFPGWYGGRTIHFHYTVRIGGVATSTSQLYFEDALSDSIVAAEPIYSDRGPRDTTNEQDGIFRGAPILLETAQMADGAMLAWKALVVTRK